MALRGLYMKRLTLIPYPRKVEFKEGELDCRKFELRGEPCFATQNFAEYAVKLGAEQGEGIKITYGINPELPTGPEGYILDADENGIEISASSDAGIRYAFCTLRQLYHNYGGKIPYLRIEDEPYLKFRGMHFDCCRHFFPKSVVLKFLDFCYLHKLNVFHWHLSDDQGWRIEIEKYPKLTEIGSVRSGTYFDNKPHGGFYTKSEIKEVIAYANVRGIEVIPEIDMPGHMQAALASYPELGCFDRKIEVCRYWGIMHDVLCVGKESTYEFVFGVLEEVMELFGGNTKYVHIGGDEVVRKRWHRCEHCRRTIEREGLRNEHELQAYFMKRVADWVVGKGFIPIVWNGVVSEKPINDKLVWQFWLDESGGDGSLALRQATNAGGYINSNLRQVYLDLPYGEVSFKSSYKFNPLPKNLPADKLVGAEFTLWTEYVQDFETACKRLLPRACALAEAMWLDSEKDGYKEFLTRLEPMLGYLKKDGYDSSPMNAVNPNPVRAIIQSATFRNSKLPERISNLIGDYDAWKISRKLRKEKKN